MKIYLAARYSRADEMQGVRDVLHAMGHQVTSRWIDHHGGTALEAAAFEALDVAPESVAHYAQHDIEDILAASLVCVFTSTQPTVTGGHHTELGFALGARIPVVIVGPRTNVFHALPQIAAHYRDWSQCARAFATEFHTRSALKEVSL